VSSPPAAPLQLREVDPSLDARWDGYVEGHPDGLVFQHSGWLRGLQRENGRRPLALVAEDAAGAVRGVLPLMATRGLRFARGDRLARRRLASLPRTPVAGPLADDRATLEALVRGAVQRTAPGTLLQLKPSKGDLDGLVDGVAGQPWRLTYEVELPSRAEDVRHGDARTHAAVKRAVGKAVRAGVRARPAHRPEDVRAWYALYLETMRHHVVPARSLRFFEALWDELRPRGMLRLLLAERDGELLAGSVLLMLGSTVFYAFNGVRRDRMDLRPNDLLHWEAIRAAAADGYSRYDLGEVAEGQDGLSRFKRKWGGQPRRLRRYYFPAPDGPAGEEVRPPTPGARAAHAAWRHVPLSATALLGDRVNRFL
jgi:CelD/BcsL family acetyltransferase involved in cellulose biosynthesis